MYDDASRPILDVRYDKDWLHFDQNKLTMVIPKDGFILDFDDYDESNLTKAYRHLSPSHLTFKKRRARSLHYAV